MEVEIGRMLKAQIEQMDDAQEQLLNALIGAIVTDDDGVGHPHQLDQRNGGAYAGFWARDYSAVGRGRLRLLYAIEQAGGEQTAKLYGICDYHNDKWVIWKPRLARAAMLGGGHDGAAIIVSAHGGRWDTDKESLKVPKGCEVVYFVDDGDDLDNSTGYDLFDEILNEESLSTQPVEEAEKGDRTYDYSVWYASEFPSYCGIFDVETGDLVKDLSRHDENNPLLLSEIMAEFPKHKIYWLCCRSETDSSEVTLDVVAGSYLTDVSPAGSLAAPKKKAPKKAPTKGGQTKTDPVKVSPASTAGKNIPLSKYYVFNETGNIMVATTADKQQVLEPAVQELFQEVSVFFAAMTEAFAEQKYTLYDAAALESVIDKSGLFIQVHKEDQEISATTVSADFNTEMIASLLGIAASDGADLIIAQKVLRGLGEHVKLSYSSTTSKDEVGHLLFVCEYLVGMPLVSAVYYHTTQDIAHKVVSLGPCVKGTYSGDDITFTKNTYLFVAPKFIRKYSADLAGVRSDKAFGDLVKQLRQSVPTNPHPLP